MGSTLLRNTIFVLVLTMAVSALAISASGANLLRAYSTCEDFAEGTLQNVECVGDQLRLTAECSTLPFIWVPNQEGTVSKIDTVTGRELARYRTCPPTVDGQPSRTTVDLDGSCWVANRYAGTVVKIGLLEAGGYLDRNGNGVADTSRDIDNDGNITGAEMLPWGQDECVLYEVVVISGHQGTYTPGTYPGPYTNDWATPGPRTLAIDKNNNLWIGCLGSEIFYYVSGQTGQILGSVSVPGHRPYGGLIDRFGVIWSSGHGGAHVLWLDTNTTPPIYGSVPLGHFSYGVGINRLDQLFVAGWEDSRISRINVQTKTRDLVVPAPYQLRGVACTADNDVWVACSSDGYVYRYDSDLNYKGRVYVGAVPTGVAVDSQGKVWVCDLEDENVSRIDPVTMQVDLVKRIVGSGGHYSYSDMTGSVSWCRTVKNGKWTVVCDSGAPNTYWKMICWNPENQQPDTLLEVRASSSVDGINWSPAEVAANCQDLVATPSGRYLQVEVTFRNQSTDPNATPVLDDLAIWTEEICDYNILEVGVPDESKYVRPGEAVTVQLKQRNLVPPGAAGYQAFLSFDTSKLTFVSGAYTNTPYSQPIIFPIRSSGPGGSYIDLAAGIGLGGDLSTSDAVLANLQFTAASNIDCATTKVEFRPHQPPSQFTDFGGALVTCLVNEDAIVIDGTKPELGPCPPDIGPVPNDPGQCSAVVQLPNIPASDNCSGIDRIEITRSDGGQPNDPFPVGVTTVTCVAVDKAGNVSDPCTFTVTVADTELPTITCPPDVSVNNDPGKCEACNVDLGTPTVADNCGVASVTNDAPTCFPVGETTVTWTVTDVHGNRNTCTQKVTVRDNEKPVGTGGQLNPCYPTCDAAKQDAVAKTDWTDNCGVVSETAECELVGCFAAVTVTACDAAGNCGSVVYNNVKIDNTPPEITCPSDIEVYAQCGVCGAYVDLPAVIANDNCDGPIAAVPNPPSGSLFPVGTSPVTYTATDSCGNSKSCTMYVTVKPYVLGTFTVELEGIRGAETTRCITFTFGGDGGTIPPVAIKQLMTFVNGKATVTIDKIPACINFTKVSAKDERHSLRRKLSLSCVNGRYEANFAGAAKLLNGDLSNDNAVDIVDFGILAGQFGSTNLPAPDCYFPAHHADITGDQRVDTADFTFILVHFLNWGDPEVGRAQTQIEQGTARTSIPVPLLAARGVANAQAADLNKDNKVDMEDVKLFVSKYLRPKR